MNGTRAQGHKKFRNSGILFAAWVVSWVWTGTGFGQAMSVSDQPEFDPATVMLFRFDQNLAAQTTDGKLPVIQGPVRYVAGRFGSAAVIDRGGIKLPKAYNALWEPNAGTVEFFFKADDPKWFQEGHSLLANNLNFCQAGNWSLWYWADYRALRVDLHLPGDCGYLTCGLPSDTEWHHIAVTWDNRQGVTMYIDGQMTNYRPVKWDGMWIPKEMMTLVVGDALGAARIYELRISKVARPDPNRLDVTYTIGRGEVKVKDGRTVMMVGATFANESGVDRKVAADLGVTDYFQVPRGRTRIDTVLKPGGKQSAMVEVPVDESGPYLKVAMNGTAEQANKKRDLIDERPVFTDILVGPRQRLDLNGAWEVCDGDPIKLTMPGPKAQWAPIELPHRDWTWNKAHTKWFRKRIDVPRSMQGKTVELKLSGVRYRADVFVNGQSLGGYDTDQMPLTVDATKAIKAGESNELLLAVTDWISCVPLELKARYAEVAISNTGPGGKPFIRPHGSMVSPGGIVDPIFLEATEPVSIEGCYVTPSVRKSNLTIRTVVSNRSGKDQKARLAFSMIDQGKGVMDTGEDAVLRPGQNVIVHTAKVDLAKIKLWDIGEPYLYRLRATVKQETAVVDQLDVRFGFREFWADGPVFRLNGRPIKPVLAAGMPYQFPFFDSPAAG